MSHRMISLRNPFPRMVATVAALAVSLGGMADAAFANPKMVVDVRTGRVIAHQEAFRKWYPASLTKLMTA